MLTLLLVNLLLADARIDPIMAIPITKEFLNDAAIRVFCAALLRQGGYGRWTTERAAFVVLEESGEYRCVAWPKDGGFHRQQFRGAIPDRTVAIIHTHPREIPLGSVGDQNTARRFSVPIFVVTPMNIYLVTANGVNQPVVANRNWEPVSVSSSTRCTAPGSPASRRLAD